MGQLSRQRTWQAGPWARADRDPSCCRGGQFRIGGQDLLMQPLKWYSWLDTEFFAQIVPCVPEDSERVRLTVGPVQRQHEQAAQPLPYGMLGDEVS
jgi:hypothetical protein